jgi:hypothetical protein
VSKIIYIKDSGSKKFIILDAAMNDLMRPALYGAFHKTLPVTKSNNTSKKPYEFVGPICIIAIIVTGPFVLSPEYRGIFRGLGGRVEGLIDTSDYSRKVGALFVLSIVHIVISAIVAVVLSFLFILHLVYHCVCHHF